MADLESITDSQFSVFRGLANPRTMDVNIQKTLPVKSRDDYTMKNYEAWRKTLDEVDVPAFDLLQRAASNEETKRDSYERSAPNQHDERRHDEHDEWRRDEHDERRHDEHDERRRDEHSERRHDEHDARRDEHSERRRDDRTWDNFATGPSYEMNQYVKKETQIDVSRKLAYLFDSAPKFPLTRELTVHSNPDDVHDEYVLMRRRRYVAAEKDKKVRQLLEMSNTAENVDKKLRGILFQRGLTQAIADVLPEIDFYIEEDACERWVRNGGVSNPGAEIRNAVLRAMLSNTMRNFSGGTAAPVKSLASAPIYADTNAVEPVPDVNAAMVDLQSHVESLSAMSRSMDPTDPRQKEVNDELLAISKAVSDDNQAEIIRLSQNKALRQKRMERAAAAAAAREQRMQRLEAERIEQARRQEELQLEAEMRQREAALKAEEARRKAQIDAALREDQQKLQLEAERQRAAQESEPQEAALESSASVQEARGLREVEQERLAEAFIAEQQAQLARERAVIPEEIESDDESTLSGSSRASKKSRESRASQKSSAGSLSEYSETISLPSTTPRQHDFDEETKRDEFETEVPEMYRAIINRRKPQRADDATTIIF
jgi:hypothetical protein